MFRRRHQATGGLPTTTGSSSGSTLPFGLGSGGGGSNGDANDNGSITTDGSARGIRLQSPAVKKWKQSSSAVKISYSVALISFVTVICGYRTLTYHSAKVHIECNTADCTFVLRGLGRGKPVKLTNVPRHQILSAKPVKVNKQGVVVNDNVNINEEWKYTSHSGKNGKKGSSNNNSNNYKGPDKDGNYLTYVVTIRDKDPKEEEKRRIAKEAAAMPNHTVEALKMMGASDPDLPFDDDAPSVDLAPILPFCVRARGGEGGGGELEYNIVMRQHGINQARRRVRNMIQKIDSYAKKRRHKLSVKENTTPDWRGVLMMVLGGCACLLSLLLGLFWEDEEVSARSAGPGARRRQAQQQQQQQRLRQQQQHNVNPYQRATPSKYEVNTMPKKPPSSNNNNSGTAAGRGGSRISARRRN